MQRTRGRLGLRHFNMSPPAALAMMYLVAIVVGAVLLWLPISVTEPIRPIHALFLSTSAVTVTGLSMLDVGAVFTTFGEAVLMVLMQLGGLGLMTFAVLVLSALGINVGMPSRLILRESLNQTAMNNLTVLVRIIVVIALCCEAVGVLVLSVVFVPDMGFWPGVWTALFHSVSAFNNAGLSTLPASLTAYVGDPLMNVMVTALFITGGLGFVVVGDIAQKRRFASLTLHTKLMLVGTAGLIVFGSVAFGALEWTNPGTLGGLPDTASRLWATWFQATTPRTAGFNTIDTSAMHDSTTLLTMVLMVIGGGSTSTAGGIKVTTMIVLLLATVAYFRRSRSLSVFGRSLKVEEVLKVMALVTISMFLMTVGLFLVALNHDGDFLDLMFEVTSAFATVGLSRGATAELNDFGMYVIMVVMFFGRIGPLTIGFFLATRSRPKVSYPSGQIYLG
ncbi:trk system potassium uptake protein TrkH [Loktanella fryxellensis]|uniref:Trk system potassium uptake protein TrkH n=1 Tax=Loktanella fryxellensis TaxID=245187 RepID=A0A1H7Y4M4_9RHOB|nr:potassium transporter TrkG [Loktanella fryxellensis]SEM41166.1 trk system potassium uptake protein TrkH [Loktanella fryxellensis]